MEEWIGSKWYLDNPRGQRLVPLEEPRFLTDLDAMTAEEINASDFYTELLRPRGLGWCVGTSIRSPAGDTLVFSIEKAHAKGPVPRTVAEQLDSLRPHLARASLLSGRLGLDRAKSTVTHAGSDRPSSCGAHTERSRGFGQCGISRQRAAHPDRRGQPDPAGVRPGASASDGSGVERDDGVRPDRKIHSGSSCRNRTRLRRARRAAAGRGPRCFHRRALDCLHDVDHTERKPRAVIAAGAVRLDACRSTDRQPDHRRKIHRTNFVRDRHFPEYDPNSSEIGISENRRGAASGARQFAQRILEMKH